MESPEWEEGVGSFASRYYLWQTLEGVHLERDVMRSQRYRVCHSPCTILDGVGEVTDEGSTPYPSFTAEVGSTASAAYTFHTLS